MKATMKTVIKAIVSKRQSMSGEEESRNENKAKHFVVDSNRQMRARVNDDTCVCVCVCVSHVLLLLRTVSSVLCRRKRVAALAYASVL